jgi:uncharacterized phage protein gp47/JayE
MAFQRPTLPELIDRVEKDFVSRLSLSSAVLRRALVKVFARVVAGAAHMMHGHMEFLSNQMFPDVSELEFLERQANIFGLTRNAPGFAEGTATVTGTNGVTIPADSVLIRSDSAEYTVDADVTIASGTATVSLTSSLAGATYTLDTGVTLSFESPIAGASSTATVVTSTQDGSDQESDSELRTRLLARLQNPPHGGNETDYVAWAKEVSGVTRAWCYPLENGAATVSVRFVRDDDASIIPSAGEVSDVQTYIDALRPVTATVTVLAPVATPVNFTLHITPDTTATRAAVTAELTDMISRLAEPGVTLLLSDIETAIKSAAGVTDRVVTIPAADVTFSTGQLATMGTITWT